MNRSYFGVKFQDSEDNDHLRLPNSDHFSNSKSHFSQPFQIDKGINLE